MTARTLRAVVYARVSRDEDRQDPASQLHALRALCASRGFPIVKEYADHVTGDPARRQHDPPGLVAALMQLQQRRADVLVIFAADRLVRSPVGLLQLIGRIHSLGAKITSATDGDDLDTTTPNGELTVFLKGWFSRWAMLLTRERTLAGLQRARAEGKTLGRPETPLPDLERVRALLQQGKGERAIVRELGAKRGRVRRALKQIRAQGWSTNGGRESEGAPERAEGPDVGG